jgi:2-polyprenyl-3-methyl-5-hydroxy-6-metoxy-1,4-benzoquinol methylase
MNVRMVFGKYLVRLGRFIQSLAIMVMKPDDLVEFSRQTYAARKSVEGWGSDELIDSGLDQDEKALLTKIPFRNGRLLLLDAGGGREAIPLAQMGFEITVLDFVPEMVQKTEENARKRGLHLQGVVQEISKLDMPNDSFDIVWLSAAMYSSVPTMKRRIDMLRRIHKILKSGGYFICQFHWMTVNPCTPKVGFAKKIFSLVSFGNFSYEKGDIL